MTEGSTRAIAAAFAANLGIAAAKFTGYLITGSSSMLAESVHSLADSGNQGLLVLGGKRARRPASDAHPFGHGRDRYFWSFVVALVLFTLGGAFALYEGIHKLADPHELTSPLVAVAILVAAIGMESLSLRTAVRAARPLRGDQRWATYIRRSKSPELPVVLLEDLGALIGLVLALAGVGMSMATGNPIWDGVGTVAIGALLVVIAAVLAVEMKSLLIGEAATDEHQQAIRQSIVGTPQVRDILDLRTLHLGPEEILVAAKLELAPALSVREVAETINAVEDRVRSAVPEALRIYLEPDLRRPATDGAMKPPTPQSPHPPTGNATGR